MAKARNETFTSETQKQIAKLDWYHSLRLPNGELIKGFQTEEQLKRRIAQFPIPEDLTGMRVLDIGAWDGWFSFEMERRGAKVVAIDLVDNTRFPEAKRLMNSRVEHYVEDITYLRPDKYGTFDIVLFFGVLYHLKHPLLALERVCELSSNLVCVESFVSDEDPTSPPVMEFYEGEELAGQFDNWCGPSLSCLMAFCRTVGFAEVTFNSVIDHRAHITCQRLWENTAARGGGAHTGKAPQLLFAENPVLHNHNFSIERDDYVSIWFRNPNQIELSPDTVYAQVGPFGIRPAGVRHMQGDLWQASCKVPLGLADGWHDVTIAVSGSDRSNAAPIQVGTGTVTTTSLTTATAANGVKIDIVSDGKSWERYLVHTGAESCISLWVHDLPPQTNRDDVLVRLAGTLHPASFLSDADDKGAQQINALLPTRMPFGKTTVAVRLGETESEAREVEIVPPASEFPS